MPNLEPLRAKREEVAYFMRRLYKKGLTTCSGGNISLRTDDGFILTTPSALDKGELTADQVVVMKMNGENLTPELRPTIEVNMHLAVLKTRQDIKAVVHAHPVFATTFACMNLDIDSAITGEVFVIVGPIARAGFAVAGTQELADMVAASLAKANASLMQNHGVITVGDTMLKAFDRIEVVEAAAKMTWITKTMNCGTSLSAEHQGAISAIM